MTDSVPAPRPSSPPGAAGIGPPVAVPETSLLDLIGRLVRIPSRAGRDDLRPVMDCIDDWLARAGVTATRLQAADGLPLAVLAEARGHSPAGPWIVLDATLDTAGFGDPAAWSGDPAEPVTVEGWLRGRGSADSKAGVALFAHLLVEFAQAFRDWHGRLTVLFDGDEHSGRFGGARAFFDRYAGGSGTIRPDGVFIGYPGMSRIVTGGRGFLRAVLTVRGVAAHSGSAGRSGVNAVLRAAELCRRLESLVLPAATAGFGLPAKLTVTGIETPGHGYSQVPDACHLFLDLRLTPDWDAGCARVALAEVIAHFDAGSPASGATSVQWQQGWPACQLAHDHPLLAALRHAARQELGGEPPALPAGPSSIGNYLATLGIPAVCGFGVQAEGVHAANEGIALASLAPVYRIYRHALRAVLDQASTSSSGTSK